MTRVCVDNPIFVLVFFVVVIIIREATRSGMHSCRSISSEHVLSDAALQIDVAVAFWNHSGFCWNGSV